MRRDVPEPWARWLVNAGFVAPNNRALVPSARQLANRVGVNTTTLMEMMYGTRDTDPRIVEKVAGALGVDVRKVSEVVGQARTEKAPYEPPAEARLLSRRQQRAISELIRAIAEERGPHAAATTHAGESPAPEPPIQRLSPVELYLQARVTTGDEHAAVLAELDRRRLPHDPAKLEGIATAVEQAAASRPDVAHERGGRGRILPPARAAARQVTRKGHDDQHLSE